MSRSYRKTPIVGMTTSVSDKSFKRTENKRARRKVKSIDLEADLDPNPKEYGNPWKSRKDGKQYIDPDVHPKLMRK